MRTCYNSTEQWLKGPYARIGKICGVKSQVGIAAFLGIKQSSISVAKKRQTIPLEWLLTLWEKVGANPVWILTGRGKKFLVPSDTPDQANPGSSEYAWALGHESDPASGCPLAAHLEALVHLAADCPRAQRAAGCNSLGGCLASFGALASEAASSGPPAAGPGSVPASEAFEEGGEGPFEAHGK